MPCDRRRHEATGHEKKPLGVMRTALISDIHANLPALDAVLADIARRGDVDSVFHLGDLVGYAPWPNEVVQRLRDARIEGIAGNYDSTVATDYKHCGCRYDDPRQEALSQVSYAWTRAHVSPDTKAHLGRLPFRLDLRPLGGHVAFPCDRSAPRRRPAQQSSLSRNAAQPGLRESAAAHCRARHPCDAANEVLTMT